VYDLQTEHFLKGVKIVVPMQQFVLGLQTESGNQAIDSLSDGVPALPQVSIVLGGSDSQNASAGLKNLEPQELGLDPRERALASNPLQYLAKNEVRQSEPLPLQFAIQPTCFWVLGAPQIIDPHGCVDDDHSRPTPEAASGVIG
jgi:hypothetical protein